MSTPPKNLPRFLPTLTEVIDPTSVVIAKPAPKADANALVSTIMEQMSVVIDQRLNEKLAQMLSKTVSEWSVVIRRELRDEIQNEVCALVTQAVADALSRVGKT